jgi:enoyl-[acyl-carrier protein] reductase II
MRHHPGYARLETLSRRGRELLGSEVALMGGAMTWVSERHLVAAISNAGGFGVVACGSMGPDLLAAEIEGTRALTDRPFGVNLILMHPELDALIDRCTALGVGHVVFAGGMPTREHVARAKAKGAKVMAFAPSAAIG